MLLFEIEKRRERENPGKIRVNLRYFNHKNISSLKLKFIPIDKRKKKIELNVKPYPLKDNIV